MLFIEEKHSLLTVFEYFRPFTYVRTCILHFVHCKLDYVQSYTIRTYLQFKWTRICTVPVQSTYSINCQTQLNKLSNYTWATKLYSFTYGKATNLFRYWAHMLFKLICCSSEYIRSTIVIWVYFENI